MIKLRDRPVQLLANDLRVCAAAYVFLHAGAPTPAVAVSGCGDRAEARADAIFQAASLTKPVVAYAALRLVIEGQLDLKAPVSRYLPGGYQHFHSMLHRLPEDAYDLVPHELLSRISVAQLLNHTSGLPNWSSGSLFVESDPGKRWSYSGEGFVLLQSVIESVVKTDLSTYLDHQIFVPLGMTDTSLIWRDAFAERAVSGNTWLGFRQNAHFGAAVGAASLYTTATDYARFMSALLADDRVTSLILSDRVEVDAPLGLEWGLGWGIERAVGGPYIWQWGNNAGFRTFAMASVRSKDGFVVLTNSDHGMPLAASLAQSTFPVEHNAFRFPAVN